jgi:transcriptional regulator with XRE-family HTH domain
MGTKEKIFAILKQKNIEQKELANFIGTREQTISDWKSGKTNSYTKYIDKISVPAYPLD